MMGCNNNLAIATTLPQVVAAFAPEEPLHGEQLSTYYIERENAPWQQMKALLQDSTTQATPARVLLTGNVGSGKSTELNKLLHELDDLYSVVTIHLHRIISPIRLTHIDLLLIAGAALAQAVDPDTLSPVLQKLMQGVTAYFEGGIFDGRIRRLSSDGIAGSPNATAIEFDAFYQKEPVTYMPMNGRLYDRSSGVIDAINLVLDRVQVAAGRPLLFVFDDTDKIVLTNAELIFFDHPATLAGIHASAIYTVPSGLWYSPRLHTVGDFYAGSFRLSDIRVHTDTDKPDMLGRHLLDEMISRRMTSNLIAPEVREQIIEDSNGRARQLIGLVHFAAVNAIGRKGARIEQYDADRAAFWLTAV